MSAKVFQVIENVFNSQEGFSIHYFMFIIPVRISTLLLVSQWDPGVGQSRDAKFFTSTNWSTVFVATDQSEALTNPWTTPWSETGLHLSG